MNRGITIERQDFGPALREFEGEWEALLERSSCPTIYSTFEYVYTSCLHFKKTEDIFFLFFRRGDRLLAIFPISVWDDKLYGVQVQTLEHGITTNNSDIDKPYPIIDKEYETDCWICFRNYLRKEQTNWDVVIYDELFSGTTLVQHLQKLFPFPFYWTKLRTGPESPIVRLDGDWADFEKAHPNMRKKNRRIEKRIGNAFSYKVTGDPADIERCLNEYIATEQAGWKAGEAVSEKENQRFYHDLLPKLAAKGQVFFGMMYDGEKVISAEISYVYGDTVYFALGVYNPEYKHLSPGSVSTSCFMKYFYGKGYVEGDFLAGFAHYINPWASRIETTTNIMIRRMGWKNWYFAVRHLIKKVKTKVKKNLTNETAKPPSAPIP